jgi:hypothetical protein
MYLIDKMDLILLIVDLISIYIMIDILLDHEMNVEIMVIDVKVLMMSLISYYIIIINTTFP